MTNHSIPIHHSQKDAYHLCTAFVLPIIPPSLSLSYHFRHPHIVPPSLYSLSSTFYHSNTSNISQLSHISRFSHISQKIHPSYPSQMFPNSQLPSTSSASSTLHCWPKALPFAKFAKFAKFALKKILRKAHSLSQNSQNSHLKNSAQSALQSGCAPPSSLLYAATPVAAPSTLAAPSTFTPLSARASPLSARASAGG